MVRPETADQHVAAAIIALYCSKHPDRQLLWDELNAAREHPLHARYAADQEWIGSIAPYLRPLPVREREVATKWAKKQARMGRVIYLMPYIYYGGDMGVGVGYTFKYKGIPTSSGCSVGGSWASMFCLDKRAFDQLDLKLYPDVTVVSAQTVWQDVLQAKSKALAKALDSYEAQYGRARYVRTRAAEIAELRRNIGGGATAAPAGGGPSR